MQKNNIIKIPERFIPLKMPNHKCKTCNKQSTILFNGYCAKCLKLTPLGDFT